MVKFHAVLHCPLWDVNHPFAKQLHAPHPLVTGYCIDSIAVLVFKEPYFTELMAPDPTSQREAGNFFLK